MQTPSGLPATTLRQKVSRERTLFSSYTGVIVVKIVWVVPVSGIYDSVDHFKERQFFLLKEKLNHSLSILAVNILSNEQ